MDAQSYALTVFAVSDGTATTVKLAVEAVLVQFPGLDVNIRKIPELDSEDKIERLIAEAVEQRGIIVFTLVTHYYRERLIEEARLADVPAIDLLGPVLFRLESILNIPAQGIPGIFKPSLDEYDSRIEAINFTVDHDNGQNLTTIGEADIILLGVSRTSKTPLSIYLASKGWKVANVPVVPAIKPSSILDDMDPHKVVGLTIDPFYLAALRRKRMERFPAAGAGGDAGGSGVAGAVRPEGAHGSDEAEGYTGLEAVRGEVLFAETLFRTPPRRTVIDVTGKSIEEVAHEVISAVGSEGGKTSPSNTVAME